VAAVADSVNKVEEPRASPASAEEVPRLLQTEPASRPHQAEAVPRPLQAEAVPVPRPLMEEVVHEPVAQGKGEYC
jgi:hypothetical protein